MTWAGLRTLLHQEDAARAGTRSLAELRRLLDRREGEHVYRMEVRLAGPDPRVALRERAELTEPEDWSRPLAGQVTVVTGASRGIGEAIAETLARDGAHVICLDVPPQGEALTKVANRIGGSTLQLDITSEDAPRVLADHVRERHGSLDGVWMDSGASSVAAIEAFEDAGVAVPPITGEDQQDFLQAWQERDLTAIAPTYPTFQWRTPVIAALRVLAGEEVPAEWRLPQPVITEETLERYVNEDMPPLHYAMCGCEDMPGYPGPWK